MAFPGGSAYAMVRDISEGYLSVTERSFKLFTRPDIDQLSMEFDRLLRELRAEQTSLDDHAEMQKKQRKLQRVNTALVVMRAYRAKQKT
ncbi:MAG TPA: hypothetical protein VGK45_18395 [Thermoanaerobaculia bacterium]|jgi:hypothetical protein|nr:hypothetical protein [Thermoanaerobaculia bacterium]